MASLDRRHSIHLGPGRVHRLLAVVKAWHHPLVGPPVLLGHQRLLERPSDLLSLIHLALLDQNQGLPRGLAARGAQAQGLRAKRKHLTVHGRHSNS